MSTAFGLSRHRGLAAALTAGLAAATAAVAAPAAPLAPGVERASDLAASSTRYVVTNTTPLYKAPRYDPNGLTGASLARGERFEILGEANMGAFLLVARGGQGVGYVPRSLVCPVTVCTNVQG